MTISNKDRKLLVYLVSVGIVALVYFFIAKPNMDKQLVIQDEIEIIKGQVNHYNEIYIHKADYEQQIVETQVNYNESVNKFFGGLNQENTLMNIKGIEDATNTWIYRVSFQEYQTVFGGTDENEASAEEGELNDDEKNEMGEGVLKGTRQDLSLDYSCKYADFKRFIEYLQNYDKRVFITSINAHYDANSDNVSGSMVLSQFAIESPDIEYSAPDLSNVQLGVDNIFTVLLTDQTIDESLEYIENTPIESLENNIDEANDLENNQNNSEEINNSENTTEDSTADNNESLTQAEPVNTGNDGRRPRPQ